MSWIKNTFLLLTVLLIMLLIMEVITRAIWGHPLEKNKTAKVMLFESGDNFINIDRGFKYFPDKSIRSSTYYIKSDNTVVKEYDYYINTNNLGLVQKKSIEKNETVDIFLGDSFTEGQGAEPWFYEFENDYDKFNKVVNGGLLGTGPLQWELLANYLEREYSIRFNKVNVIMISQDVKRNIYNFSSKQLKCLRHQECTGVSGFYGYSFHGKTQQEIEKDVVNLYNQSKIIDFNYESFIKKSAFLLRAYLVIKNTFRLDDQGGFSFSSITDENLTIIKKLINRGKLKGKVYLIPEKRDFTIKGNVQFTKQSNKVIFWLRNNNIEVVLCDDLLIDDFHVNDSHPNEKGYKKIRKCVSNS